MEVHGSGEVNAQKLSQKRAELMARYVQEQLKLKPDQIRAVGLGNQKLRVPNISFSNRARNRRVQFRHELTQADPQMLKQS